MKELLEFWVEEIEKALTANGLTVIGGDGDWWTTPAGCRCKYKYLHIYQGLVEVSRIQVEFRYASQEFFFLRGRELEVFNPSQLTEAIDFLTKLLAPKQQ